MSASAFGHEGPLSRPDSCHAAAKAMAPGLLTDPNLVDSTMFGSHLSMISAYVLDRMSRGIAAKRKNKNDDPVGIASELGPSADLDEVLCDCDRFVRQELGQAELYGDYASDGIPTWLFDGLILRRLFAYLLNEFAGPELMDRVADFLAERLA